MNEIRLHANKFGLSYDNICVDYPEELQPFFGREIKETYAKEFTDNLLSHKYPIFVKPKRGKYFTGFVFDDVDDVGLFFESKSENMLMYTSECVNFICEWRVYVRYGEVMDIRKYYGSHYERLNR